MPSNKDNKNNWKLKNLRKKKGGRNDDEEDESVDSKGNIRGLIAYSDESEEEYIPSSESDIVTSRKKYATRSKDAVAKKKKTVAPSTKSKKYKFVETSEESEESDRSEEESYMTSESEESEEEVVRKRKRSSKKPKKSTKKSKKYESSSEEEEDDEDESEEEEEYDEDEDEDYDEEEEGEEGFQGIQIHLGGFGGSQRMVPKRHNMKKESKDVKKFVKLVTKPAEENNIDTQIDMFKALPKEQQAKLLDVLETHTNDVSLSNPDQNLMFKILTMNLPTETQSMVMAKYNSLQNMDPGSGEYFKLRNWLEKITSLPLGIYKEIPVKLDDGNEVCGKFMDRAKKCLEDAIYGQDEAKLQILQFISRRIVNPNSRGLSLLLIGPPGIGKTSLIKNGIAKALEWPLQFVSLGGDSDATTYTGHQLVYEGSHCGKIVNCLAAAKSMSMILMFDELDKISTTSKGEEVQHLLVHMTDPVQNDVFEDKYLSGIPIDLSRVMFVFSGNDINRIDKVLLDRFVVVELQGYNQKEKCAIAENYLWPQALKEVGLGEKVGMSQDLIKHIIEHYAKEENGVRELKRCLEQITLKLNMLRMYNDKSLPFYIKDFKLPFELKKEHIDVFLKKKESRDKPPMGMYI